MKKLLFYLFTWFVVAILISCKESIKPELKEEMEAYVKKELAEAMLFQFYDGHPLDNIKNIDSEITDIKEERYEFKGDKYGTYVVYFKHSFDDNDVSVKMYGTAVFSYDGNLTYIQGDKGFFIDAIFVGGSGQDIKTSKYNFARKDI